MFPWLQRLAHPFSVYFNLQARRPRTLNPKPARVRLAFDRLEDRISPAAGDVLVSDGGVSNKIWEYTQSGTLVRTIDVPKPGDTPNRGIVVDANSKIEVFNGTGRPYLSTYDPATNTWQHQTNSQWHIVNNAFSPGGIATSGPYVFVGDQTTAQSGQGIICFNTATNTSTIFATDRSYGPMAIGLDGLLYAVSGSGGIDVFDPVTFVQIRSINLSISTTVWGLAVDASGNLYTDGSSHGLDRWDSNGNFVAELFFATSPTEHMIHSLALSTDGKIVVGRDSTICLTDTNFSPPTSFTTTATEAFVAWATPQLPVVLDPLSLKITGLSASTPMGQPVTVTVTVQNSEGQTDTAYTGTVHFSNSDAFAGLLPDYTFKAADQGVYSFSVVFNTSGTQTLSANDTLNPFISGTETTTVPTLPFTDSFSPTQSSLTATNWQVLQGGWSQSGGQTTASSLSNNFAAYTNASAADVSLTAQNVNVAGGGTAGLFARQAGSGAYLATISNAGANGQVTIFELKPAYTILFSVTMAQFTTPVTLRFDVVGVSLRVFINGTLSANILNGDITVPGRVGLYGSSNQTLGTFTAAAAVPVLSFSDPFTPNQAALTAANWQVVQGSFAQSGGQAVASSAPNNFAAYVNAAAADVSVSAQNVSVTSGTVGVFARQSGSTAYLATISNSGANGVVTIFELTPAYHVLSSTNVVKFNSPVTLRFDVVGNSLKVFVNNTLYASLLNVDLTGAGLTGIYGSSNQSVGVFSVAAAVPALPFSDNFAPSQSTLTAANWQAVQGGFSQNGTQAVASAASLNIATYTNASVTDVSVSAQNVVVTSGGTVGLVARFSNPSSYYLATISNSGSNGVVTFFQATPSGFQVLTSATVAQFTSPVSLVFTVQGNTLKVFVNGTLRASVLNAALTDPGVAGLWGTANETLGTFTILAL